MLADCQTSLDRARRCYFTFRSVNLPRCQSTDVGKTARFFGSTSPIEPSPASKAWRVRVSKCKDISVENVSKEIAFVQLANKIIFVKLLIECSRANETLILNVRGVDEHFPR